MHHRSAMFVFQESTFFQKKVPAGICLRSTRLLIKNGFGPKNPNSKGLSRLGPMVQARGPGPGNPGPMGPGPARAHGPGPGPGPWSCARESRALGPGPAWANGPGPMGPKIEKR